MFGSVHHPRSSAHQEKVFFGFELKPTIMYFAFILFSFLLGALAKSYT